MRFEGPRKIALQRVAGEVAHSSGERNSHARADRQGALRYEADHARRQDDEVAGELRLDADTIEKIIEEMKLVRRSERENRVIDHDQEGSMEIKKREGYF